MKALDLGADDYITEPYGMDELFARVRAAMRRSALPEDEAVVTTPDFTIDLAAKTVIRDGEPVRLTPRQWHIVDVLVRNAGKLVTHEQILREVWGPSYGTETNYLRVFMTQIRQRLEPEPSRPRYFTLSPALASVSSRRVSNRPDADVRRPRPRGMTSMPDECWVTADQIAADLTAAGLAADGIVMVHASLSAFGWIVGGVNAAMRALLQAVGPDGTVCAYAGWEDNPYHLSSWPSDRQDAYRNGLPAFDPAISEARRRYGRLPERIRTWPGARRSVHPEMNLVAVGRQAEWLTASSLDEDPGTTALLWRGLPTPMARCSSLVHPSTPSHSSTTPNALPTPNRSAG